jgi:hypothetical protein
MATKNLPAKAKTYAVSDWAAEAKAAAAKQTKAASVLGSTSPNISFRAATLSIGGIQQRNNKADIVVLATMQERAYYEGDFDPDNPRTPVCYAYGEVDGELPVAPHEKSQKPQNATCKGCPNAEWGSANQGRGQACRQHFKFIAVQAQKTTAPDELGSATLFTGRIPPTSLKAAKVYLDFLGVKDAPTFAVTTELEVRPSTKSIFTVHLEPGNDIPKAWQGPVLSRLEEARKEISAPFPEFDDEPKGRREQKAAPKGKRRF